MDKKIGKRFGKLTVIKLLDERQGKYTKRYECLCDCGNSTIVLGSNLKLNGGTRSCGCTKNKFTDYSGRVFKGIEVLNEHRRVNSQTQWLCKCHCGRVYWTRISTLQHEKTVSCGCIQHQMKIDNQATQFKFVEGTSLSIIRSNKLNSNNKSGYKGVHQDKKTKKWIAQITFKGKCHSLGTYENISDAISAREKAEEKFYKPILEKYNLDC